MKHFRVKKKSLYRVIESYNNYRDWMFFNKDYTQIEILPPTLDNLAMMQEYGFSIVIKGFRNPVEYNKWERLRFKFGMISVSLITRCLGTEFMLEAISLFSNGVPLPDTEDITTNIENSRFLSIRGSKDEKRLVERNYYLHEYNKYSYIIHRELLKLFRQNRVDRLSLVQ